MEGVIHKQIMDKIQQLPQFGLIIDETTDVAIHKDLIIYCKDISKLPVCTSFYRLIELQYGTASSIYNLIVNHCETLEGMDLEVRTIIYN